MLFKGNNLFDVSGFHAIKSGFNALVGKSRNVRRVGIGSLSVKPDIQQPVFNFNLWLLIHKCNLHFVLPSRLRPARLCPAGLYGEADTDCVAWQTQNVIKSLKRIVICKIVLHPPSFVRASV